MTALFTKKRIALVLWLICMIGHFLYFVFSKMDMSEQTEWYVALPAFRAIVFSVEMFPLWLLLLAIVMFFLNRWPQKKLASDTVEEE